MLVTDPAAATSRQGFRIEYVDGAFRTEVFAGANAHTLALFGRLLPLMAQHVGPQTAAVGHPEPSCAEPRTATPPLQLHHLGVAAVTPASSAVASTAAAPTPDLWAENRREADESEDADDQPFEPIAPPVWLSEAIARWRTKAGVKFSEQSWKDSYKPTFRVFREMLGNTRRDIVDTDGTTLRSQLDIRLAELQRGHMELVYDLMQKFPSRQGKRNDGLEAPAILKRAAAQRQKPQSSENTAKKMRQLWPFIKHAGKRAWLPLEIPAEFSVHLEAAENRASECDNGVQKKGAIALSIEELCGTFKSEAYLSGAMEIDWKYWVDPMRLYTGARVSELGQLYTNDIIEVDGIPCISFVNDVVETEDETEGGGAVSRAETIEEFRRLKNRASRRIIPVHPKLIEMGFLDWVEQRRERVGREPGLLFYGLTWEPKSGYGRKASRHTLNLLKAAGVWRKRTKVGHSLRSNCAQELLRVGTPFQMVQRYVGHTTGKPLEKAYGGADAGPAYQHQLALEYLRKTDFGVTFPSYAEVRQMRVEHARAKQLARKNGYARRQMNTEGAQPDNG